MDWIRRRSRRCCAIRVLFTNPRSGCCATSASCSSGKGMANGMARHFEEREWKVETWLLRAAPARPDWIEREMTDERRRTILSLKHLRSRGQLRASSYDIYRAVVLGGARDAAETSAWLRSNAQRAVPNP